MKSATYLLSAILIATAAYAGGPSTSEQQADLQVVKIVKKSSKYTALKNQPGPADRTKEDKTYMKMIMDAQPHLKPEVTHILKGDSHEK